MELLDENLRSRLPPFHSQDDEEEPMVHAHFYLRDTSLDWYVIEGQPEGDDFAFFGFVAGPRPAFRTFRLSELQSKRNSSGQTVERDATFTEGRLTDVVPAPDF